MKKLNLAGRPVPSDEDGVFITPRTDMTRVETPELTINFDLTNLLRGQRGCCAHPFCGKPFDFDDNLQIKDIRIVSGCTDTIRLMHVACARHQAEVHYCNENLVDALMDLFGKIEHVRGCGLQDEGITPNLTHQQGRSIIARVLENFRPFVADIARAENDRRVELNLSKAMRQPPASEYKN